MVPIWLDRLGQVSWRLLVVIALLGVVVAASVQVPIVVVPLVLGIVLAATLAPFRRLVRRAVEPQPGRPGATLAAGRSA